jgi:predicted dehydrogenase
VNPEAGEPLRLGIVGCGSIAQAHAAALRFLTDDGLVRVTAAADPDPAGVERVVRILGDVAHTGDDCMAVIGRADVDAVVNITPTRFHREYVAAIAAAGKPCFTEKPLAPTFDAVCDIVQVVRDSGIPAQVGFQSRFHPLIRRVRAMVESAEAGAPMAYTLRDDQFWPTGGVVPGHSSWRSDRNEAGGGALLEHSIHSCDILGWLFGPVERVYATTRHVFGYSVEDVAALTIEHTNGVVGNLVTVFNGVQHREERRLEVFFERAAVELTTDFLVGAPEDSFLVHRAEEEHAQRYDVSAMRRDAFAAEGFDPAREVFVYQYFAHHAFATALRAGTPPSPNVDDALRAHALVEAAYRSAQSRRAVEIAELGADIQTTEGT